MELVQWLYWSVSGVLQMLVLASMLKGAYKKYPLVFAYSVVLILTMVIEIAALADAGYDNPAARRHFWINDLIRQFMLFTVVIGLTYQAQGPKSNRGALCRLLVAGAALVAGLSFFAHRQVPIPELMTTVGRNLSFCSAVLTLVLWSLLILSKDRDRLLLLVTGGLGIQFTAEAIGQSLRYLAANGAPRSLVPVGNLLLVSGHLVCLYVWFHAFQRLVPRKSPESSIALPSPN